MAKISTSSKKKNGIIKLKIVAMKLHKSLLSMGKKSTTSSNRNIECEEVNESIFVPKDVEEGHFAVIADGEEPKRFVVPLSYLTHPMFLRLLEQAAEEYGFDHEGALTIPCQSSELEMILEDQQWEANTIVGVRWSSCKTKAQIC